MPNEPQHHGSTTVVYRAGERPEIAERRLHVCVVAEAAPEQRLPLTPAGLVVGSQSDCGLVLADPAVSRRHLLIQPAEAGVLLRDLGSTNGTFVGGLRVTEVVAPPGTAVFVGETRLEIVETVERIPVPLSRRRRFGELLGESAAMREVYTLLERAGEVDVTVLLEGATGTGKELAARALHAHSARASGPFQVFDCGAVSPTLIESELFGHVKGAFTGADRDRPGAFELASGGTLFLDEIGELPLALQPKLLRALESRVVKRVGGLEAIPVDVRFVAATNRDLRREVKRERFREDLLYRLDVFRIVMPPLTAHREDIPLLVKHFLGPLGDAQLDEETLTRLAQADWPGNVRELRNAVERAVILLGGNAAAVAALSSTPPPPPSEALAAVDASRPFKDVKADLVTAFERVYIERILERTGGNVSAAAREAGIDRKHLERLIRKHGIESR